MQQKDFKKYLEKKKERKDAPLDQRGDSSAICKSQAAVNTTPSKVTPIHPQRLQTARQSY